MSKVSMVEMYPQNKVSKIAIRPYFDPAVSNMGLERYGLSLFDGGFWEEPIICLEQHGVKRYVTGLNEFAPEVKMLPEEEQIAKIKEIRKIVSELEKQLASNVINPSDKDFWSKVVLLKPNNEDFWDGIKIRVSNDPVFLDPVKDPYDLIKLRAIEAGGFSTVARSLEAAREMAIPPRFYLDKLEDTVATRTEVKKLRNKALALLEDLYNTDASKMLYVAKVVDSNSAQYRKSTPNDIIYENLDRYINGELIERDKRKAAQRFIDVASSDMAEIKIRAIVKDATYYKMMGTKSDGFIYHIEKNVMMGRTPVECIEFLNNPLNEEVLEDLLDKLGKYWNS